MADRNTRITGAQIKDGTILASELATDAVETLKIKDANVTAGKLASDSVETLKIKDKNVTLAKLEDGVDAQLLIAGAAGVPAYKDVSGDVTIDNAGVTTIGALKVATGMIAADAVDKTKIAADIAGAFISQAVGGELDVDVKDEDNMVSDSAIHCATQQSIKAYVDAQIAGVNEFTELTDTPGAFAGSGGYYLKVNVGADAVEFVSEDNPVKADFIMNEVSTTVPNDVLTDFLFANDIEADKLIVSLNGLVQEEGAGAGHDYEFNPDADNKKEVRFATAPAAGDIVMAMYIKD